MKYLLEKNPQNQIYPEIATEAAIGNDYEVNNVEVIQAEAENNVHSLSCRNTTFETIPHNDVLTNLLNQLQKIDYYECAVLVNDKKSLKLKHLLVISIEAIIGAAKVNRWGLCTNQNFLYVYNEAWWQIISDEKLQKFLGEACEKLGIDPCTARHYQFRDQLLKQFMSAAYLPKPELSEEQVLVNLKNGTYEISVDQQRLRLPQSHDLITYQLPFDFTPDAEAPLFEKYLNKVLPDKVMQKILSEYMGYVFIRPGKLKLERALVLHGTGSNGKSVLFEVINALLGRENTSSFSIQHLTDHSGYTRAMIGNKLLNYTSEMNGKLDTALFKQLVSGEPVEARLPYGIPFILTNYAKLIFNCNQLPHEVEKSPGFYRRFLILPFEVTIEEKEKDVDLANKIIRAELSGVFNWVLAGLKRLLLQGDFTFSQSVEDQREKFKRQTDNVLTFLDDENYIKSNIHSTSLKVLFSHYKDFCNSNNFNACSSRTFNDSLKNNGYTFCRKNTGNTVNVYQSYFR